MDTAAVPAALQLPQVLRALEELTMLAKTDAERERYEARRKHGVKSSSITTRG
jgi:hypothetical protein